MTARLAKLVELRKAVETRYWGLETTRAAIFLFPGNRENNLVWAAYTDSTDAALALLKEVLPGVPWSIMFEPEDEGREYQASMNHHTNDEMRFIHEFAPTLARALLLAMLSALIDRERTG